LTAQDRKVQTFTAWVIRSKDQQDVSIDEQFVRREFVTGEDGQNFGKLLGLRSFMPWASIGLTLEAVPGSGP
jgi:hypothetical protein